MQFTFEKGETVRVSVSIAGMDQARVLMLEARLRLEVERAAKEIFLLPDNEPQRKGCCGD